jgi:hypothetical protein
MNAEKSSGSRLLGWSPFLLVCVASAAAWAVFLRGGFPSIVGWLALLLLVPVLGLVLLAGTVVRSIQKRRGGRRLGATLALAALCLWPAGWQLGIGLIAYPYHLDATSPSATVRVPTDVPMRVLWGGDDLAHNHHAAYPDQRWAYDLAVEPMLHGSARLEDYGCWGVPVVAPASGLVRVAHDGEPDRVPGAPPNDYRNPLGNHVAIAIPTGGHLVLAHLAKGSVSVRDGDEVTEGARIGACGNSGNSSEPHVHIHLQRQDARGRPVNYSEGLPLFFRDHDGAPMPAGGIAIHDDDVLPTGAIIRHVPAKAAAR